MPACSDEWNEALSAFVDGEVEPEEGARVEAHLERCTRCAAAVETLRALGVALRASAEDEPVPDRVSARARALSRPPRARWPWALVAATAIAALVPVALRLNAGSLDGDLREELVAHHLRGFASARPCELESSDPVAVRAWVEQRLGYEVDVPTPPPGAELIGARACRIEGRPTAALLYRYESAPMTVFVPPPGSGAVASAERFASSGERCTEGPMGERICVSPSTPRAFAVARLPASRMLSLLGP